MTTLTLRRRYPFGEFDALFRTLSTDLVRPGFTPAAEVVRDGEDAVVRVELPGLDLERDVTVEVERGALVVRGERRDERSDERDGRVLREVRYGSFRRSFGLPKHVAADQVSAGYDAGVLSIRVPGAYKTTTATRVPVSGEAEKPATGQPAAQS